MTAAEEEYADALAAAIATSLQTTPPPGALVRVVVRWFEGPDYLTIHALGAAEEDEVPPDDAWLPLEWPDVDREIARVDAVMEDPRVAAAVTALASEVPDGWDWDGQPLPLVAAAERLRASVVGAGVPVSDHFAVATSHFEAWGPHETVRRCNPPDVVELLDRRGLLPDADD